ncbi:MAG: nicotinate (nicotinamide) nucleotide adenylyltransferase [Ruminococcus sp.]|nr:nicotinate (nicotinamide) nucleotide adenylyltransferase [Ruminococcus sp.]
MKLGIFGGSFNPPHKMHEDIAKFLVENKYLEKVVFVPTGNKYQKRNLIDFKDRYNMLKLITSRYDYLEVSDFEYKKEQVYTYETLAYYKMVYPDAEIYFICGLDNLKEFKTWKNYEEILNNYKILVIERNNDKFTNILTSFNEWKGNIVKVDIPLNNVSSTIIRENILNDIYDENLINKDVINYIKEKQLYKE